MDYYILVNSQQLGPFPESELLNNGVTRETLVWTSNMPNWENAGCVPSILYLFKDTPPSLPPEYPNGTNQYQNNGQLFPPNDHLSESILVTLLGFFCMPILFPFSIIAIIKSLQVNSCWDSKNYLGAYKKAASAHKWNKAVLITILVLYTLLILYFILYSIFSPI